MHPRIHLLQPGIGVGGHCIPIDPYFLINKNQNNFKTLEASINSNNLKTSWVSKKILKIIKEKKFKKILLLGLSYKENIGDLRESPALKILKIIAKKRGSLKIYIYDPYVKLDDIRLSEYKNIIPVKKTNLKNYKDLPKLKLVNHKIFKNYQNLIKF